jgi:hypothetical protein
MQELRPVEKKALLILQELPEDSAEHALSYLEFLTAKLAAEDAKWDALFASTTDEQWEMLLTKLNEGEATGIDDSGDELKPIPQS